MRDLCRLIKVECTVQIYQTFSEFNIPETCRNIGCRYLQPYVRAVWRNWIARKPTKLEVVSSNLTMVDCN